MKRYPNFRLWIQKQMNLFQLEKKDMIININCSRNTTAFWIEGENMPSHFNTIKLAKYLGALHKCHYELIILDIYKVVEKDLRMKEN